MMPEMWVAADLRVSIERCGGPERVVTDAPDPEFRRRRVGFTEPVEVEE